VADVIPKDIYHGMDKDNRIASVNNLLVAHENMDDKTAYAIVKAVFEHKDELVRTHKEAENIKLENQKAAASPVPWHPGALKYFAEKGINLK
jgi:TRAP transporter TAXI family solute receptor